MNPVLELRWKIAMLRHLPVKPYSSEVENERAALIRDMETELAVLQRFLDEALADGARQAAKDREKSQ